MDIYDRSESPDEPPPLVSEQGDGAWVRLSDDRNPISWPADLVRPSNNYSYVYHRYRDNPAEPSMPLAAPATRTWNGSPSNTLDPLRCGYYPPLLALAHPEEALEQNWARAIQLHERDTVSELTEDMATPQFNFRPYNTSGPNELSAESPMKVPEDGYPGYLSPSHGNEQNQYFDSVLHDSSRGTYEIPGANEISSHNMRMEAHQGPLSPQPYGPFEEHPLQSAIKPISTRGTSTSPVTASHRRRPLRLNPANIAQLLHGETDRGSIAPAPLMPAYYSTSLVDSPPSPSSLCTVNSTYGHQIELDSPTVGDYRRSQTSPESPPRMTHGTTESLRTSGLPSGHLQRATSTGGLRYGAAQSPRGHGQRYWGHLGLSSTRWSHNEPSSPAEIDAATLNPHGRRESLKTCDLQEEGFPGCFVLVPTTGSSTASPETSIIEGPETGLITTKKNFRRPMPESERQAIKLNRKYGVCLRCKMFKERCRGTFPCERCRSLKFWKNICVTAQFTDKSIFNRGLYKSRVSFMLENVKEWLPAAPHNQEAIEIGNGYSTKLPIALQKFDPIDASLLDHILWRELRKTDFTRIPSSAYGIIATEDLTLQLEAYFDNNHINGLIAEVQNNRGTSPFSHIYADTLLAANKYSIDNSENGLLVQKALRIWAAQIVFFKGVWRISGSNTANMSTINDRKSKLFGITPLPRLANLQLDAKVESWIADLEQDLLSELQHKIFRRNPADWFGIYLALFVILSSLERDTWGLETWAFDADNLLQRVNSLNLSRPDEVRRAWTWPLQETPKVLIEKNLHLVETLTAHFRSITKGWVPFTLDWYSDPIIALSGGEEVAVRYMRSVGQCIKESESLLRTRPSAEYSKDYFDSLNLMYCSRLMVPDREDA